MALPVLLDGRDPAIASRLPRGERRAPAPVPRGLTPLAPPAAGAAGSAFGSQARLAELLLQGGQTGVFFFQGGQVLLPLPDAAKALVEKSYAAEK